MTGDTRNGSQYGIVPRSMQMLFDTAETKASTIDFALSISFVEVYMDKVFDLLQFAPLTGAGSPTNPTTTASSSSTKSTSRSHVSSSQHSSLSTARKIKSPPTFNTSSSVEKGVLSISERNVYTFAEFMACYRAGITNDTTTSSTSSYCYYILLLSSSIPNVYNHTLVPSHLVYTLCSYSSSTPTTTTAITNVVIHNLHIDDISGIANRVTSTTRMNSSSSRSHSIFTVYVSQTLKKGSTNESQRVSSNSSSSSSSSNKHENHPSIFSSEASWFRVTSAKLVLVDLAGSELVGKSSLAGQQLEEAKTINKSLSALGQVISALTVTSPHGQHQQQQQPLSVSKGLMGATIPAPRAHVPYRNSKLTYLLRDCIGGTSRMVPSSSNP